MGYRHRFRIGLGEEGRSGVLAGFWVGEGEREGRGGLLMGRGIGGGEVLGKIEEASGGYLWGDGLRVGFVRRDNV